MTLPEIGLKTIFSSLYRLHQTFPQGFTGKRGENGLKCSRQHSVDITAKSASRFFMTGDTKCCLHCLEEDFLTASNAFAVSNVYRLTPDAQPYTSSCRVAYFASLLSDPRSCSPVGHYDSTTHEFQLPSSFLPTFLVRRDYA